ncbi:MAG: hypothetical protein OQK24_10290 [Magnetovibrio sp.]|nr:hypothetical protein [Magnetovibrio sp.]
MNTSISPDFAGRIHLCLGVKNGHVASVNIESTRPQGVTKIFAGRSAHETVRILGLIFSLCSTAQSMAALGAIERALGGKASKSEQVSRDILREAEMLSQTVMRVAMDWPQLLGLKPDIEMTRAALNVQSLIEEALFGGANWKQVGGAGLTPDVAGVGEHLLNLQDVINSGLYQDGLADQLLAALDEFELNGFGALGSKVDPELGALTRHWYAADVVQARETYGAGLRARLMARLVDLEDLPKSQMAHLDHLGPCSPSAAAFNIDGTGEATVETARGALTHKVEIKDGLVAAYEISAPTDLNFEANGVVAIGLRDVAVSDKESLQRAAELHVLAVDPCVKCDLVINDV